MSKSLPVSLVIVTVGKLQYQAIQSKNKNVYSLTISQILGIDEKGYKLKEIHSSEYHFKLTNKQVRLETSARGSIDCKKETKDSGSKKNTGEKT